MKGRRPLHPLRNRHIHGLVIPMSAPEPRLVTSPSYPTLKPVNRQQTDASVPGLSMRIDPAEQVPNFDARGS